MNHGEITAVLIVAIVMIASIFRTILRGPRRLSESLLNPPMASENRQLRSEVQELKERIKVLERITVDKENSLSKEIESLRDR
jgi:DNA mismatch repair protein MutH